MEKSNNTKEKISVSYLYAKNDASELKLKQALSLLLDEEDIKNILLSDKKTKERSRV